MMNSQSQRPPSIPPLSFGENLTFMRDRASQGSGVQVDNGASHHRQQQDSISAGPGSHLSSRETPSLRLNANPSTPTPISILAPATARPGRVPDGPRNPPAAGQARVFPRSFASARAASQLSSAMSNENGARPGASGGRADLHTFMTRHVRMEPSRLDDFGSNLSQSRPGQDGAPVAAGQGHTLEPLRPDGLNTARQAQLVQQFRREHLPPHHDHLRGPDATRAPHTHNHPQYPHYRHQAAPAMNARFPPSPPALRRRTSLFGLSFENLMDSSEEGGGDGHSASNRIGPGSETPSVPSSTMARPSMIESEDEAGNEDASVHLTTARRRRLSHIAQAPEMIMFGRGFRRGRAIGDFMVCSFLFLLSRYLLTFLFFSFSVMKILMNPMRVF